MICCLFRLPGILLVGRMVLYVVIVATVAIYGMNIVIPRFSKFFLGPKQSQLFMLVSLRLLEVSD